MDQDLRTTITHLMEDYERGVYDFTEVVEELVKVAQEYRECMMPCD